MSVLTDLKDAIETKISNLISSHNNSSNAHSNILSNVAKTGNYNDLSNKPTVDNSLSTVSTNAVQNQAITNELNNKSNTDHNHNSVYYTENEVDSLISAHNSNNNAHSNILSTVAKTGSYNDLSNKPTIPSAITVDNAISSTSTNPVQNKVIYTQLSNKAGSSHTHDERYYTESEVNDLINALKTWTTVYNANGCKLQVNTTTREAQLAVEASVNISSANTDIGITTVTTTYKPPKTMRVVAHNGIANIAILIFSSDGKLYGRCTATGSKTLNGIFRYSY